MLQPQSDEEIRPVLEALRRLDPLLDFRWNPKAVRVRGSFDVAGKPSDARWDGRWEIIRYDTPNLHAERTWAKIITVTEIDRTGKYPILIADGAYRPIAMDLVDYMALYDRANTAWIAAMEAHWQTHESNEENQHKDYTAAHQEGADKVFHAAGGRTAIGGAQGKGAPEAVEALWGAGRRGALVTSTGS